jgi:flagellin-like protein
MNKGVSPLIATVLLIAFTIAVGGIISVWLTSFTTTTTQTVGQQSQTQIVCGTGGIQLSNVGYCSPYITGYVSNTGSISLGNITFTVLYADTTREMFYTQYNSTVMKLSTCCGNFTMLPGEKYWFNFSISKSNYQILRVVTNCTTITDEVDNSKNEITKIC